MAPDALDPFHSRGESPEPLGAGAVLPVLMLIGPVLAVGAISALFSFLA
jgi:hypothetical protein